MASFTYGPKKFEEKRGELRPALMAAEKLAKILLANHFANGKCVDVAKSFEMKDKKKDGT